MKLGLLLSLNHGIVQHRAGFNPFHFIERNPFEFLERTQPPRLRPIQPALGIGPPAGRRGRPKSLGGRIEGCSFKLVAGLAIASALGCGFGAQRIAYTRQKAQLGRMLQQKELEVQEATQARRVLESGAAMRAAQGPAQIRPVMAKAPAPGAGRRS